MTDRPTLRVVTSNDDCEPDDPESLKPHWMDGFGGILAGTAVNALVLFSLGAAVWLWWHGGAWK